MDWLNRMWDKIEPSWLRMFTADELNRLISGAPELDLEDLRNNTVYTGYSDKHEVIGWFWDLLNSFDSMFSPSLCV